MKKTQLYDPFVVKIMRDCLIGKCTFEKICKQQKVHLSLAQCPFNCSSYSDWFKASTITLKGNLLNCQQYPHQEVCLTWIDCICCVCHSSVLSHTHTSQQCYRERAQTEDRSKCQWQSYRASPLKISCLIRSRASTTFSLSHFCAIVKISNILITFALFVFNITKRGHEID